MKTQQRNQGGAMAGILGQDIIPESQNKPVNKRSNLQTNKPGFRRGDDDMAGAGDFGSQERQERSKSAKRND